MIQRRPSHRLLRNQSSGLPANIAVAPTPELQPHWRGILAANRAAGDAWLRSLASLLLAVPSALVPRTNNVLFNPMHPDAESATIVEVIRHPFDSRLYGV